MQLIAVVLGAPTSAKRFSSAKALLDYGFANYKVQNIVTAGAELKRIPVHKGVSTEVSACAAEDYSMLRKKSDNAEITTEVVCDEFLNAPIAAGDRIGSVIISDGTNQKEMDLLASENVNRKSFADMVTEFFAMLMMGK